MSDGITITGIVIYCCDPRPEVRLWKRIKKDLIPPEMTMAAVGVLGGPISLANQDDLKVEFNFLMQQIYFALSVFPDVKEIVVVSHDCGYYGQITRRKFSLEDKKEDLKKAMAFLRGTFPHLDVNAFFANRVHGFEAM